MFFFSALISFGASSAEVKRALNDLPTLYPEGVSVVDISTPNGEKIYNITFSADRGRIYLNHVAFLMTLFNKIQTFFR